MFRKEVAQRSLRGKVNIEAAVNDAAEKLIAAFNQIDDPVFRKRAANKAVSLCGEIAGNPTYTALPVGLGVRCLSVVPGELLESNRRIRSLNLIEAEQLASRALAAGTIAEVKTSLGLSTGQAGNARSAS